MEAIVAALDLEENALLVAQQAAEVAEKFHAALHLIHVVAPSGNYMAAASVTDPSLGTMDPIMMTNEIELLHVQKRVAEENLNTIAKSLSILPLSAKVLTGDVESAVLDFAKSEHAGMIVIGTHQYRGLTRLLMHETSVRLLHESNIPVLVVPTDVKEKRK